MKNKSRNKVLVNKITVTDSNREVGKFAMKTLNTINIKRLYE